MYCFQLIEFRRMIAGVVCAVCLSGGMGSFAAEIGDPMEIDLKADDAGLQLVQIIRDTTNANHRFQAVAQLISIGEAAQSHSDILINVMKSDVNPRLRAHVAVNLHKVIDVKKGVAILVDSLWDNVSFARCSNVADSVARGIGNYGESAKFAVPMIQKTMTTKGPNGKLVGTDLRRVLGEIDPMQFPFYAYGEKSVLPLAKVLGDNDPALRRQAIARLHALSETGKPALPAVEASLRDSDEYVQVMAASMVLRFGENDRAASIIDRVADNVVSENRLLAIKQAGSLGDRVPTGQTVLRRASKDENEEVRKTAYLSLNSVPALISALDDSSPLVVEAAVKQLARFGSQARPAVDSLRGLLAGDDATAKVESAIALRYITGRPEALPVLIEVLKVGDYRAKTRAVREMKYFPPAELTVAGDVLVATLASDEKALPYLASNAIKHMENHAKPWLPQLLELTNHSSSKVKSRASYLVNGLEKNSQQTK